MKHFDEYTKKELISLTVEDLDDLIKFSAIMDNIKIPIPYADSLKLQEGLSFVLPADTIKVYRLVIQATYSSKEVSNFAFPSEEIAREVAQKCIPVRERAYNDPSIIISDCVPGIQIDYIIREKDKYLSLSIKEDKEIDYSSFYEYQEEKVSLVQKYRTEAFMRERNLERKKEYLRLAKNDEEIARLFWARTESIAWPEEEVENANN